MPYNEMPKQLCTAQVFREKIAGGDGSKSLIKVNLKPYGIPQGSPISDVLANIYLLRFDSAVRERVASLGGFYFRYSDDILLICPGGAELGEALAVEIRDMIKGFGPKLTIKEKKSSVFVFTQDESKQTCHLVQGTQGRNGLEYLGFRFDGKKYSFAIARCRTFTAKSRVLRAMQPFLSLRDIREKIAGSCNRSSIMKS